MVPYYPSSVAYEAKPNVNGILLARVKQEGVHRNVSQAENNMSNVPVVSEALLNVCPKIEESQTRKQTHSESKGSRTRRTSLQRWLTVLWPRQ